MLVDVFAEDDFRLHRYRRIEVHVERAGAVVLARQLDAELLSSECLEVGRVPPQLGLLEGRRVMQPDHERRVDLVQETRKMVRRQDCWAPWPFRPHPTK